ncbi:MAG: ECF transporter S component [Candidatus Aerophobetes bacterium]|nr:ECF transporter S component [Candidatus Aerophobetes bacterium]
MEKKSLWTVGTREVVYMAIGAALYAVFSWIFNIFLVIPGTANVAVRPAVVIPLFFGAVFGPWVGLFTGLVGNIIGDLLSGWGFWIWWDIGNGLMGLFAAFAFFSTKRNYALAELWAAIGVIIGMGLASLSEMWVSGADMNAVISFNFVPAALTNLVNGLILLPILLRAYMAVTRRAGR